VTERALQKLAERGRGVCETRQTAGDTELASFAPRRGACDGGADRGRQGHQGDYAGRGKGHDLLQLVLLDLLLDPLAVQLSDRCAGGCEGQESWWIVLRLVERVCHFVRRERYCIPSIPVAPLFTKNSADKVETDTLQGGTNARFP